MNRFCRWLAPLACTALLGCAHAIAPRPVPLSPASQALASQAGAIGPIASEEDYFDAKLLYQALPEGAPEQAGLRAKLLEYLLGPIAPLDGEKYARTLLCSVTKTISTVWRIPFVTPSRRFLRPRSGPRMGPP